jgi:V8-like Glu-specific endopeptidase
MGCCAFKSAETIDNNDKTQCIVKNASSSFVPEIISEKISSSILRIEFEKKISTGFFIKINLNKKHHNFILTCAHSISQENINSKITMIIFYGKINKETEQKIKLDSNERFIKCFMNYNIDATIIEVLQEDNIPEDKYLYPDLNYENGYDQYIGNEIFTGGYPKVSIYKGDKHFSSGSIRGYKDKNKFNFCHNCATEEGSSGSPLINVNLQVIGIHYGCNGQQTINHGVFIGEIIKNLILEQDKIVLKEYKVKSNEKNQEKNLENEPNTKRKKKKKK